MASCKIISYLFVMIKSNTDGSSRGLSWGAMLLATLVVGVLVTLSLLLLTPGSAAGQTANASDGGDPGAAGSTSPAATSVPDSLQLDPIARLQIALDAGEVTLAHDTAWGYLPSLLEVLDVPTSSQGLVFSRTSLQTDRIAPWAPRAIYFNDDVYIGYVQEGPIMEIASVDPDEGAVFYTLSQSPDSTPTFQEETTTCLMCHSSTVTKDVPGFMVLSVLSDRAGYSVTEIHKDVTTDRTPLEERWGGWYVTGTSGDQVHAGNQRASRLIHEIDDPRETIESLDLSAGTNVTELDDYFHPGAYLEDGSDIVALMVLTHQTHVHNLMASAQRKTAEAMEDQRSVLRTTGDEPPRSGYLPTTKVRIETVTERLLEAMLFMDEASLHGPVRGTTSFAEDFQARGPFDSQGRSLRQLELESRLFEYPMSFLVYSDAFKTLPQPVKQTLYRRLWEVLTGQDESGKFDHLDEAQRAEILEILSETVPEFGRRAETDTFEPL